MNKQKRRVFAPLCLALSLPVFAQAAIPGCITSQYGVSQIETNNISIKAPTIAEQGSVISIGVNEISNLPSDVYVTELSFYNEFRKEPVAKFTLGKQTRGDSINTRFRLPESSNIYAVAVLSDGRVIGGEKHVKVTIGGCGGGGDSGSAIKMQKVCDSKKGK